MGSLASKAIGSDSSVGGPHHVIRPTIQSYLSKPVSPSRPKIDSRPNLEEYSRPASFQCNNNKHLGVLPLTDREVMESFKPPSIMVVDEGQGRNSGEDTLGMDLQLMNSNLATNSDVSFQVQLPVAEVVDITTSKEAIGLDPQHHSAITFKMDDPQGLVEPNDETIASVSLSSKTRPIGMGVYLKNGGF